ncbi:MAG TPA: thiamine pyrophosphate-binding protein, partial [Vicinamibacterales bacterium]|nr:thiamine pyrophosphate-binding protein [Vicinamibacterales bacterium]
MPRSLRRSGRGVSRRHFLRDAATTAGVAIAASAGAASTTQPAANLRAAESSHAATYPLQIPAEFSAADQAAPASLQFPMTGAQVFAQACKDEGVAALFCCPGNYAVVHALAGIGVPTFSGRHEGSMTHAADAFIRVTGEIAVASGTEGPGFTDMICGIACANAARTPLMIVASNMSIQNEDTEAGIQLAYQQPTTEGMKKYGKRLVTASRVHEYAAYAFRQLHSGVPRPVHLDFPVEVAAARFKDASELSFFHDKTKYRTDSRPHPSSKEIDAAVALLRRAERPMIVSSNGVFYRRAWEPLRRLAEKAQIPVVE